MTDAGAADNPGRLFEAICANVSVALVAVDGQQRCIQMNAAAEEMTGYTVQEVRGRSLHDVLHCTRPDGSPYPRSECLFERAFLQDNRHRGEEVFVHKDGRFYDVAYCASPIREAGVRESASQRPSTSWALPTIVGRPGRGSS